MAQIPVPVFQEPLDFPRIVFEQIGKVMRSENDGQYFENVERFADLLCIYTDTDEDYKKEVSEKKLKPDFNSPFYQSVSDESKKRFARELFRALMKVIHRSGFLPHREVEGVISEYDAKLIDKLLELEKLGVKKIEHTAVVQASE